jgi:hypothetical protein
MSKNSRADSHGPPFAAAPGKAPKPKKAKPSVEGQKEMLLPIAGKKTEEKKPAQTSSSRRKAG